MRIEEVPRFSALEAGRSILLLALALVAATITGCGATEPTCTSFKYSAWGTCQPDGGQTRVVTNSSPAGCTDGSPVLSRACSAGPDGAALYAASCASSGCHRPLASSTLKGSNTTAQDFRAFHGDRDLSDTELMAILAAVGP